MSGFDTGAYERRQSERHREVSDILREFVALDRHGYGPAVEFLCPQGHSLKRYRVDDQDGGLFLAPLPGEAAQAGPVATDGSPTGRGVCEVSGCPS